MPRRGAKTLACLLRSVNQAIVLLIQEIVMQSGQPVSSESPEMPYRLLGRTGARVSAIGLGGWHIGLKTMSEALSIQIIRTAIDRGITFLDNSWDYNEGASEIRMGKALLGGYRRRVFLM